MRPRDALKRALILLLALAVPVAGCLSAVQDLTPATSDGDGDGRDRFISDEVKPTGDVKEFNLYLRMGEQEVYPGQTIPIWGFSLEESGPVEMPGPEIRVTEGDVVKVNFYNMHPLPHTIHWHGLHVPWNMDGVPYLSQEPVASGAQFTYTFEAKPSGTFWFHCHVDAPHHIDMGMYAPFIVEPQAEDRAEKEVPFDREETLIFDDIDTDHNHNFNQFVQRADPTNNPTGNPYYYWEGAEQNAKDAGNSPPPGDGSEPGPLAPERDWYPVTHPAYDPGYDTFLINGYAFPHTAPVLIDEGELLKLRLINVASGPVSIHLHGHSFWVTHRDGYKLDSPFRADTLGIFPGERYDILVHGDNPGVWAFHDHMGGHTSNDKIFPGGALTVMAYTAYADQAPNKEPGGGTAGASGDFLRHYLS